MGQTKKLAKKTDIHETTQPQILLSACRQSENIIASNSFFD